MSYTSPSRGPDWPSRQRWKRERTGKASHTNGSPASRTLADPREEGRAVGVDTGPGVGRPGAAGVAVIVTVVLVVACSLCILLVFCGDRLLRLFPAKADPGHGWEGEGVIRV